MEKSASRIGRRKFLKLPSAAQHKLLAELAGEALDSGDFDAFFARYEEMHGWAELDRFPSQAWLSPRETAQAIRELHLSFCPHVQEPVGEASARPDWRPRFPVWVALDRPRSPYNVGAALRLVDNFGLAGLAMHAPWIAWDHPQLRKAARGCEAWIPKTQVADLREWLRSVAGPVVGLELDDRAEPIETWEPPARGALVLGHEQHGLAESLRDCCDALVYVPMWGFKRSLNLTHALAIAAHKIAARHGAESPGVNDRRDGRE